MRHDLIVIGDGPAAHTAALEAKRLGADVLLILPPESEPGFNQDFSMLRRSLACRILTNGTGGPRAARSQRQIRLAACDALRRIESTVAEHVEGLRLDLEESKVRQLRKPFRFREPLVLEIGSELRSAGAVILSEPSRPRRPEFFPFDDRTICDDDSIFERSELPRSVAVIGANEEGCELASVYAALGASVVLIDRRGQLMRGIDRDLLQILHPSMHDAGIDIVLNEEITGVEVFPDQREPYARLTLSSGRIEECECVAVCAGRVREQALPGVEEIELGRDASGFLITDEFCLTSQPGIYGIGDVSGLSRNQALQNHLARVAVLHAAGLDPELEDQAPHFVHSIPELATVGLSAEACDRLDVQHVVGVTAYPPKGGWGTGSEGGLLKLVAHADTGRLIGVHVVGICAGDTLQLGFEYLRREATVNHLAGAILNSPGPAEAYRLAARDALSQMEEHNRAYSPTGSE